MTLALRRQTIVDRNHIITLEVPDLRPGDRVEIIVLVEQDVERGKKGGQSFLDAIAGIEIDAPADYSTAFENQLYTNPRDL